LLVVVTSLFGKKRSSPRPGVTPTPTPQSQTEITPTLGTEVVPTKVTERLPLTAIAGHKMLTVSSSGTSGSSQFWQIDFTKDGPQKNLLYSLDGKVVELALSNDSNQLAYTYTPLTSDTKTGIQVLDIKSRTATELVNPTEKYYRLPVWSQDNLYLSAWGSGDSASLFDMTTKRRLLDLSPSSGQMGPIVFIPNQAKISYIDNGTLYESEYSGQKKTTIISQLHTLFSNSQPDLHLYSPSTRFVALHNSLGQLIVYDKSTLSQQVLTEGNVNGGSIESFGTAMFFDTSDNLVFSDTKKNSYDPGTDDNPLYYFNPYEKKSTAFFPNPKTPVILSSIRKLHSTRGLLLSVSGFMTFTSTGSLTSNCDYTKFSYSYQETPLTISSTSPFTLLTPDDKYLFNISTNQVSDTFTCAVSGNVDTSSFTHIVWLK
jgi:hypothetical protein